MCLFTGPVEHVSATQIFAAGLPDGRQSLVYSMSVAVRAPLAMVLPLPVPANGPDDAVEFVDLEGYPTLFDDLRRAFVGDPDRARRASPLGGSHEPVLEVHAVGAFEASYVPSPRDFDRLDPRFRLPPSLLAALPMYADWGFAVFQLAPTKLAAVHPMAMKFPRRERDAIFFPTTHVHDGTLPTRASFDHSLYAQLAPMLGMLSSWSPSQGALGDHVGGRQWELFDPAGGGRMTTLRGDLPNTDVWLRSPQDVSLADMSGRGQSYRYQVKATYFNAPHSRWHKTISTRLPQICRGLRSALAELVAHNAQHWRLGPLAPDLPGHFLDEDELWAGTDLTNGRYVPEPEGPGRVVFRPVSNLLEPQEIELGFVRLPSHEDAEAIQRELSRILDRIASEAT